MKLHEELSRNVSERDTPMNTYAQSNYDIQASFFRTTQQMGEKDNIATEQQALAKAEAARMLLEKAIDRQYALIESKLYLQNKYQNIQNEIEKNN